MAGKVEALVLEAWGRGIRIDADDPAHHGTALVRLLILARDIDDNEGRCSFRCYGLMPDAHRCALPAGHKGEHQI